MTAREQTLVDLLLSHGYEDEAELIRGWGYQAGDTIIVRTMTHTYIGTIQAITPRHVRLEPACWVSESNPRWCEFLTGETNGSDIDRYPHGVTVALDPASEMTVWPGPVPETH